MVQQMRLVLRSPKHYFASKKTVPLIVQWSAKFCKCSINSTLAQNNSAPKRRFNLLNALQNKIPQRALLEALTCLCGNKLVQNTTMPSYSHEEFLQHYCQPDDRSGEPGGHTLGYGGASTGVER